MIKIRIRNAGHEVDVCFPISESELFAKLAEIHAVEHENAAQSAYVTEVHWPEEFSALKNWYVNLDELNYLGTRMSSCPPLLRQTTCLLREKEMTPFLESELCNGCLRPQPS